MQDPNSNQNAHILHTKRIGFAFSGLEPNNDYVGQEDNRIYCPGRMNTSPEQETSIICVTYIRTKGHGS